MNTALKGRETARGVITRSSEVQPTACRFPCARPDSDLLPLGDAGVREKTASNQGTSIEMPGAIPSPFHADLRESRLMAN